MRPGLEPTKLKAAMTYNAAADHFDDQALSFWERYGSRTIDRLSLPAGRSTLLSLASNGSALPSTMRYAIVRLR